MFSSKCKTPMEDNDLALMLKMVDDHCYGRDGCRSVIMIIVETSEQGKMQESKGFSPPPHSETRCHLVTTALQLIGIYSWQVLLGVSAGRGKVMVG